MSKARLLPVPPPLPLPGEKCYFPRKLGSKPAQGRGRICSKNFINGCSHNNVISDIMTTSINSKFCISRIYLSLSECINLSWDFITEQTEAIYQINGRERISLAVYKGFQTADSARFGISVWCHNSSFAIDTKILSGNYFTGSETSIPKAKIKICSSPTFCHFQVSPKTVQSWP